MKLSFREKLGYGLGDTASNFVWATIMSFLMFFYTDIFGISPAAAGALLFFARLFNAGIDFLMGILADRTQTRWGKFRPYLLWMALPLALVATFTFTVPDLSARARLAYAWVTYNLLMVCYTAINIPYSALSGVMTDDPMERTSLNSYRMVLAQVGGLAVSSGTLWLIAHLGGGNDARGYQYTMALFGVVMVLLFWFAFATTRERIHPLPGQRAALFAGVGSLFSNRHWVFIFVAGILDLTFIVIRGETLMYYCTYCLHLDKGGTSTLMVLGNVGFIAGAVATQALVARLGKKGGFILGHLLLGISCAAFYFVPPAQLGQIQFWQVVNGIGGGVNATVYWAMVADTADFTEWKFGSRTTGLVFSATACSQKIGMAVAGFLPGLLLADFGYVVGATQAPRAELGITLLVSLIPAAGFLLIAALFTRYGLTDAVCHSMRGELMERRSQRSGIASSGDLR